MSTPEHPNPARLDADADDAQLSALWRQAQAPYGPSRAAEAKIRTLAANVRPRRFTASRLGLAIAASLLLGVALSLRLPPSLPMAESDVRAQSEAPPAAALVGEPLAASPSPLLRAEAIAPPRPLADQQRTNHQAAKRESPGAPPPPALQDAKPAPPQPRADAADRKQLATPTSSSLAQQPAWADDLVNQLRQHAQPEALRDALNSSGRWRVDCAPDFASQAQNCRAELLTADAASGPTLHWQHADRITLTATAPATAVSLRQMLEPSLNRQVEAAVCNLQLLATDEPHRLQLQRHCADRPTAR